MSDQLSVHAPALGRKRRAAKIPTESLSDISKRIALGTAYALRPNRISQLPHLWGAIASHGLGAGGFGELPEPQWAVDRADGFCGVLGNPSMERLIECYRRGLFPYSHVGPQKLWCPPQRHVLFFENYKIEKRVRRLLRQRAFTYTFDKAFSQVVRECANARAGKVGLTWIRPELMGLYQEAHRAGYAHSVEAWDEHGQLVGGAFGIAIGAVFFAESQFYRAPNASKCAYAVLNQHLQYWGYAINDAKRGSPFMAQQGYFDIPRNRYLQLIAEETRRRRGSRQWYVDPLLDTANWKPSALGRWASIEGEPQWLRRSDAA